MNIPPLHGKIGCKLYRCRNCENVTQSHRGEWPSKSLREKRRFANHSAVFSVIAAGYSTYAAVLAVENLEGQAPDPIWIVSTACITAMCTALWQGGRVFASLQRDGNGYIDPKPVSFASPETNMLWTLLCPLVVAGILVALRGKF